MVENTLTPITINPWRYVSKRIDPDLGLIYFGKRDYDPLLGRWLTIDPAGFIDSANLYQYVFNNPYRYQDPDGRFIIALPLLALSWKLVAVAVATAYVAYELEHQHKHFSSSFARSFNSAAHQVVQTIGGGSLHLLNQVLDKEKKKQDKEKRHTPDQQAISDLVKEHGKKGVSNADADTLLEWAEEYNFPHRDDRGKRNEEGNPHWEGGEHIHLGPKHVKVN